MATMWTFWEARVGAW
uniref:Trihelix transcription factor ASIL1 n=1 Tax=Rhizophora mucronata TaxID=61149 RepID=A0A2P2IWI7_RHIMU